ncbi:MAG: macro domain-containing protein [Candidatus Desulfofervidaceae bacterium]|nr:macro domain-containing protein [Candidatus Desulfofervidaceae bacterium]
MEFRLNQSKIEIVKGDITQLNVDAIVNAAGENLVMGGGVAGAILRAGGYEIQAECNKLAPIKAGEAVITTGGKLKARYVIHAVGPRWGEGNEGTKLRDAVLNSLKLAETYKLKTLAFPAISTGIFGCPKEWAAQIMLKTTIDYLQKGSCLEKVVFCLYSQEAYDIWQKILQQLSGEL